jgi:hypothetical protein
MNQETAKAIEGVALLVAIAVMINLAVHKAEGSAQKLEQYVDEKTAERPITNWIGKLLLTPVLVVLGLFAIYEVWSNLGSLVSVANWLTDKAITK